MTCGSRMVCRGIFLFVAVLGPLAAAQETGIFTGMIGCRFNKFVCLSFEECVNDRLFGSCQPIDQVKDAYQYRLDRPALRQLEEEISRLVQAGYTWTSLYTQCTVRNILFAFRHRIEPDWSYCDRGGAPPARYQEAVLEDARHQDMNDYFNEHYDDALRRTPLKKARWNSEADEDGFHSSRDYDLRDKKEDQFVTVHKYFADDKRAEDYEEPGEVGSDPFESSEGSPMLWNEPDAHDVEGHNTELSGLLDQLRPSDLILLKSYLQGMDQPPESEFDGELDYPGRQDQLDGAPGYPEGPGELEGEPVYTEDQSELDAGPVQEGPVDEDAMGYVWRDREYAADDAAPIDEPVEMTDPDLGGATVAADPPLGESGLTGADQDLPEEMDLSVKGPELQTLTPPDAKLLWDLIQDKANIDNLSDDEIQRLLKYVDNMVVSLEEMKAADEQAVRPGGDAQTQEGNLLEPNDKRSQVFNGDGGPIGQDSPDVTQALPDPHDTHFNDDMVNTHTSEPKLAIVSNLHGYMRVTPEVKNYDAGQQLLNQVQDVLALPQGALQVTSIYKGDINFEVAPDLGMNASTISKQAMDHVAEVKNHTGLTLVDAGWGDKLDKLSVAAESTVGRNGPKYFVLTFVLCGCIAGIVLAVTALYIIRRHARSKEKLHALAAQGDGNEASKDYQDLCRQRMQSKSSEKPEPLHVGAARVGSVASESAVRSPSSRSSTSSWSEEPVMSTMDISTGHIVLSYMEDHLKNKDRLDSEWEALCAYEAEPNAATVGTEAGNMRKNRYSDILPYDHSRVILSNTTNVSGSDYINANTITDHDPRNPAYIATQGPLPHTVADFWQMVWEQGSVVIVQLTKLTENGVAMCHRYWPEEGSDLYHIYEVHLVSEHIWCDDYLVRSFYLKNLQTNETRTVTQFHFLTWADLGVPGSAKALLDFRRKVNKSYRGRSCPIVVHCSDGVGRTGTYCLVDMVLNRMSKGAKEIDIAATLEHIRDQRANTVKTKEQFEFALAAVAEEVHAILKALPQ